MIKFPASIKVEVPSYKTQACHSRHKTFRPFIKIKIISYIIDYYGNQFHTPYFSLFKIIIDCNMNSSSITFIKETIMSFCFL